MTIISKKRIVGMSEISVVVKVYGVETRVLKANLAYGYAMFYFFAILLCFRL